MPSCRIHTVRVYLLCHWTPHSFYIYIFFYRFLFFYCCRFLCIAANDQFSARAGRAQNIQYIYRDSDGCETVTFHLLSHNCVPLPIGKWTIYRNDRRTTNVANAHRRRSRVLGKLNFFKSPGTGTVSLSASLSTTDNTLRSSCHIVSPNWEMFKNTVKETRSFWTCQILRALLWTYVF